MRKPWSIAVLAALALSTASLSRASVGLSQGGPAQASALIAKGQAALDAGRLREALGLGGVIVARYPSRWEGHRIVARAAFLLDLTDRSEGAFRQALRFAPAPARPALEKGLREAASLRKALGHAGRSRSLAASGDRVGAARAQEQAYRVFPARYALGLSAAELFEKAGLLEDARRLLEDVRARHPAASAATQVSQRLASLRTRIEAAGRQTAEGLARKRDDERKAAADRQAAAERRAEDEDRKARAAERKRADAERRAEEERQRTEKARLDREETERLYRVLSDQKNALSDAEGAVRTIKARQDDAQRDVRKHDGELDEAREKRDRARREKERWEDKIRDAKTEIARDVLRNELRSAESAYDDAKDRYNRVDRRLDDAKSRLSQAQQEHDAARRALDGARQNVRDTEEAIARIANGA